MSQENLKTLRGARYRVSLPPEGAAKRRTLDERLFVRFPVLYRLVATGVRRMPVGSRLRRASIARTFARSTHGNLDPTKCGYVLLQDGNILEHVEPVVE